MFVGPNGVRPRWWKRMTFDPGRALAGRCSAPQWAEGSSALRLAERCSALRTNPVSRWPDGVGRDNGPKALRPYDWPKAAIPMVTCGPSCGRSPLWSAVAAATAFLVRPVRVCRMNRSRKAVAAATALQGASRSSNHDWSKMGRRGAAKPQSQIQNSKFKMPFAERFAKKRDYGLVLQTCRFLACVRSANAEGRIHADRKRRHVCSTRGGYPLASCAGLSREETI